MSQLRIVHVLTHSNVTRGGAIQALLLAQAQSANGHHVEVVANSPPAPELHASFEPWLGSGLTIVPFNCGFFGTEHPREMLRFRRYLDQLAPDVLHVHRDTALVFAWLATLRRPLPAFVSQRGTTHGFRTKLSATAHRSRRVHHIIAVAQAVKDALLGEGIREDKVDVVYGSFDVERFDPARVSGRHIREELGLRDDQPLIVQVGELHKKKGPKAFVGAAKLVLKARPDCVFALVGKGKQQRKIERKIAKLGLESKIRLLGFRTDVADVYAAAQIAVNSSLRDEGLTGALREALAMETPVVATRTDGNPEVIREGQTGVLVEPADEPAMARAILALLADRDRARALGKRGRQLVLDLMHPRVRVARVEEIYRTVLSRNRAPARAVHA